MVKLFLDPNLKLSQFISWVVHTLCVLLYYRTSVLVTCCDPGSLSTDMRPTAGALVQRHLAGRGRSSTRGRASLREGMTSQQPLKYGNCPKWLNPPLIWAVEGLFCVFARFCHMRQKNKCVTSSKHLGPFWQCPYWSFVWLMMASLTHPMTK